MSMIVTILAQAAESSEEVDKVLSWGVGIGVLAVLLFLLGALVAFGGGREHS